MSERTSRNIIQGLEAKGFVCDRKSGHNIYYYYRLATLGSGKKLRTGILVAVGNHKKVGGWVLGQMAREARLSHNQFLELVDCPLSQKEYEKILPPDFLSERKPGKR